jgi:hypothetical protein
LSKGGVGKIHGLGDLADWEKELLEACVKDLASNIKKVTFPCSLTVLILQGKEFVAANP